jgi:hypothetical protein
MNKERRKSLSAISELIAGLAGQVESLKGAVEAIRDQLTEVRDEEQDAYDNLPESIQDGERGAAMTEGIEQMEEVDSDLETLFDALDQLDLDDLVSKLDEAKGA